MSEIALMTMDVNEVVSLYGIGLGCGIILSVIPMVVGSIIKFALNMMKGE